MNAEEEGYKLQEDKDGKLWGVKRVENIYRHRP
jgi:hypothetical protein